MMMMSEAERVDTMGDATREKLMQFIARIERLEGEKAEIATDIREVYSEVKSFGFDTKVVKALITLRKQDEIERAEQEALLELYQSAIDGVDTGVKVMKAKANTIILIGRDGTRVEIAKDDPPQNFMHDGTFYMHYKDNAWKQC